MSARPLLLATGAVGLVVIMTQTSCLALLCYEDESCSDGSGGGSTNTANVTASQASTALQATAVTASQSSGGGEGGGPPCDMSMLATDEANCGACGHDCAGGECSNGICGPFSIDTEPSTTSPMGPIGVFGDRVYVIVGTANGFEIKSMPVAFQSAAEVGSEATTLDAAGKWGRGPLALYYGPQSTNPTNRVHYCRPTAGCAQVDLTEPQHIVGSAVEGDRLYMTVSVADKVRSIQLDDGVPVAGTEQDEIASVEQPAQGIHEMFSDLTGQLVFTTYGPNGCVYREDPGKFRSPASCDASVGMAGGGIAALTSDPQGIPYIATMMPNPVLFVVAGNLMNLGGTPIRPPIGVDDAFIYARSANNPPDDGMVILDKANGQLVTKVGTAAPSAIDATHPDYVFYALVDGAIDQNQLFRLRKPLPP